MTVPPTGLVFSTQEEATPFLERYQRGRFEELTEGDALADDRLIVTILGSGKVKSTLRTERFLQAHRPASLLHGGLCLSLSSTPAAATIVSMRQVLEGDRIEVAGPSYPRIPLDIVDSEMPDGVLLTQDHPMVGNEEQSFWQRVADFQDSSGYAVAYVAATHGIPTSIVKSVGGHVAESTTDVRLARRQAAESLADFLIELFSR